LTLLLACVFVYLAVRGSRMEKQRSEQGESAVETFEPTPIRALAPQDLQITAASLSPGNGDFRPAARHRIEIRNTGKATYSEVFLEMEYLDAGGGKLGSLARGVSEDIHPGSRRITLEVPDDAVPPGAVGFEPRIVYADIRPED